MEIIYETDRIKNEILILPKHHRTILFGKSKEFLEIPKSIVVATHYDECITGGFVVDFKINNYIDFGGPACTKGQTFQDIHQYINWYWNSKFRCHQPHGSIYNTDIRIFHVLYNLALKFNPERIQNLYSDK